MKKLLLLFLFLIPSFLFAQVSADPSDNFYKQVERWETLGLIENQPSLRPYSLFLVEEILNTVIASDSKTEAEVAKTIYEETFGKKWGLLLDAKGSGLISSSGFEKKLLAKYGVEGDTYFLNNFALGYQLDFVSETNPSSSLLPHYRYLPYYLKDGQKGTIRNTMDVDAYASARFNDWYFQTGIGHNSFGNSYEDSIVFSPNAKHTANFSFGYNNGKINYTEAMFALSATSTSDLSGLYENKLLMMHNLDWNINKKLSLTFYETAIYGQRFDFSYMIPMLYIVTEGITGYENDNVMMGGAFTYKPVQGLSLNGDFYLDDVGFTSLKTYHDIKLRFAAIAGLKYVPQNYSPLQMVKLNYTMVSPYMYAHWQTNESGLNVVDTQTNTVNTYGANYQIYATAGQPLGSSLEPNSDRIALSLQYKPVKGLTFDFYGAFIRHANVTEGFTRDEKIGCLCAQPGDFITDGSINQTQKLWSYSLNRAVYGTSAWNKLMFLTQDTKEYTVQADLDMTYEFPKTKAGTFSLGIGYTFEYIHNYGVGNSLYTGQGWYYNSDDGNFYTNKDSEGNYSGLLDIDAELDKAYSSWKAALRDIINNYLRINFKYSF